MLHYSLEVVYFQSRDDFWTWQPVFFQGFWKGVVVEIQGVSTIFPSMSDTFNAFSQKRKFPSQYAYLFEYDIHFWQIN